MRFDVSLVLAVHREGRFLQRTLRSLAQAAQTARAAGVSVELVATLDRSDAETAAVIERFDPAPFDALRVLEVSNGSLGPTRNDGIAASCGRYVTTCDADDLISANAILESFRLAEAAVPEVLVFPEYLYAFGARYHCVRYMPLAAVTALAFVEGHPYTSRVFADRSVFERVPYRDASLASGFAYEDWHFNAECVARGCDIRIAPDTILFYRQRPGSLLAQANAGTARQIPPCRLFEPATFLARAQLAYEADIAPGLRQRAAAQVDPSVLDSPLHRSLIGAANAIDPAVDALQLKAAGFHANLQWADPVPGIVYYELCEFVGSRRFREVFLLPFIATGGAEQYLFSVMQALYAMQPSEPILVILGETLAAATFEERVPPNAVVVDLGGDWPHLDPRQRELLSFRLIQAVAPEARLHLRHSPFAEGVFNAYWRALKTHPVVYYRFCNNVTMDGGEILERPWSFEFISEHLDALSLIVTDNEAVLQADQQRLAVARDKWQCLPARHDARVTPEAVAARAGRSTRRVLWASRLDGQKRCELLPLIAARLAATAPDIRIDAFGTRVLDSGPPPAGEGPLSYRGAYAAFDDIDHADYDAFLYTSWFDGMPNVVLEAVSAGLPVIAPDVGGIGEMIENEATGVLLPSLNDDARMAEAYAEAIRVLLDDGERRGRLATAALHRLIERHGAAAYAARAAAIFRDPRHVR